MAGRRADLPPARPRPRPYPAPEIARAEPARNGALVATAGSAIVTAARIGRLLGRSGWRIARQLPGAQVVEQQTQRLRHAAGEELLRLLEIPTHLFGAAGPEEQRVMMLVRGAATDPAPLRTAMGELLQRSSTTTGERGRDYLFGTIVSQLVPDEARILAALDKDGSFPAVDVVAKRFGRAAQTVLGNASTVGAAAGITSLQNTATYLTRLQGLGLVDAGPPDDRLRAQYDALVSGEVIRQVRRRIETDRLGGARLVRKTVSLSALGRDFWAACAPAD